MRQLAPSGRFRKDLKRAAKLDLLVADQPLPPGYNDHPLRGNWKGWRDLHIEPDWLLLYRVTEDRIELARTGSHSDLFDE
jgi:mRNA interferase YafQ